MENHANQSNPLSKYFRQPAIYIKLPSNGAYWPNDAVEIPATGELAVYPMTTRDEITLRTPDALMNGAGVVEIIQSCVPAIKNAWLMPSVDVDAILIAIRIASYGDTMEVETTCPHCNETSNHGLNLQNCLASIRCPDYSQKLVDNNLSIKFKPATYFGSNRSDTIDFEQQKMLKALERADISDELRAIEINKSMKKLVEISIDVLVNGTEFIEIDSGTKVTEADFIREFYTNAPSLLIKKIQEQMAKFNVEGGMKPQAVSCSTCNQPYEVPVLFNYSSFFAEGS